MGKVKWRGATIRKRRIYNLVYADDVEVLADKEEEMRSMIERIGIWIGRDWS